MGEKKTWIGIYKEVKEHSKWARSILKTARCEFLCLWSLDIREKYVYPP